MRLTKKLVVLIAALALAAGLAACGGSDDDGDESTVAGTFVPLADGSSSYKNVSGEAELTRDEGGTTVEIEIDGLVPDTPYTAHLHTGGCGETDPGGPHFQFDPQGSEAPPNEIHLSFTSSSGGSGEAETTSGREVPAGEAGSVVLHVEDADATASAGATQRFAALFVHEGKEHGGKGGGAGGGHHAPAGPEKVACADLEGGAEAPAGPVATVEVANGEPVGGVQTLEFSSGEQIRFKVKGDEAEEIHVHGYDLSEDIPAGGGTVEFDFAAEIEGIFEIELEQKAVLIAELQVNP